MLSDFGHIEVTGQFDYATLLQSIQNVFVHQLPSIQTLTSFRYRPTHSNNFALTATILRDDWLRFFTGVDLNLLQPLSLTCSLDSKTENIDCHVVAPDLAYNGGHYQNVNVIATSPNNQLNCRGSLTKTDDRGLGTDYQLQATAVGNTLRTSLSMDNHAKKQRLRGLLNANMAFLTNEKNKWSLHLMSRNLICSSATLCTPYMPTNSHTVKSILSLTISILPATLSPSALMAKHHPIGKIPLL